MGKEDLYNEFLEGSRADRWEFRDAAGNSVCDMRERLLDYALAIIRFYSSLPESVEAQVMGKQLLRSGTSPGAQHREAVRARSIAEFASKMEGALQELDETDYWLQLLLRAQVRTPQEIQNILKETQELMAIFATSVKTAKHRRDEGNKP